MKIFENWQNMTNLRNYPKLILKKTDLQKLIENLAEIRDLKDFYSKRKSIKESNIL